MAHLQQVGRSMGVRSADVVFILACTCWLSIVQCNISFIRIGVPFGFGLEFTWTPDITGVKEMNFQSGGIVTLPYKYLIMRKLI